MASGVKVKDCCSEVYKQMKLGHQLRYIVFSLTKDLKEIDIHTQKEKSGTYDMFIEELKAAEAAKECRYALYDAQYTLANGQPKEKIVFFHWSPDTSTMKQKMVYSASKEALRKVFGQGVQEIQANDMGDLEWENVLGKLTQTDRS